MKPSVGIIQIAARGFPIERNRTAAPDTVGHGIGTFSDAAKAIPIPKTPKTHGLHVENHQQHLAKSILLSCLTVHFCD